MAGTLTAAIKPGLAANAPLAGSGLLTATALQSFPVPAGFTAVGNLGGLLLPSYALAVPLSGGGSLSGNVVLPPAFDSIGAGNTGASPKSWAHTIIGNCLLVHANLWSASASSTVTAKVGSTNLTQLVASSNYYATGGSWFTQYIFGLLGGPTGAQTLTVTGAGGAAP